MLSVILALALAQPVVTQPCGPGRNCRVNDLSARSARINGAVLVDGGVTAISFTSTAPANTMAFAVPDQARIDFLGGGCSLRPSLNSVTFGPAASCVWYGPGGTLHPSYWQVTAAWGLSISSVATPAALIAPSSLGSGFAGAVSNGSLYVTDGNAWVRSGTGAHPVLDRRVFVTESDAASGVRWFNAGVPRIRHTNWNLATVGTFTVSPVNAGLLITGQLGGTTVRVEDVPWTTGAVSGDRAGYFNGGALVMPHQRRFKICQPVGALSASTSIRIVIGQAASTLFTAPSDNPVNAGAWIRFSSAAGDTNFMLCTSDGAAAATCTSTGVAPSTTAGVGSVVCVDQLEANAVTAWVDGRARLRVTSNITTSDATTGSFGAIAETLTAATRTVSFGSMSIEATP